MKARTIGIGLAVVGLACMMGAAAAPAADPLGLGHGEQGPIARLLTGQVGRLLTLRAELNLTAEQREKIKAILQSHKAEIATVAQPLVDKRRALREAVSAKAPDEKAIRAASDDLGKAIGSAAVLASKVKAEVRAVLTPAQIQMIEDHRKSSDQSVDRVMEELVKP